MLWTMRISRTGRLRRPLHDPQDASFSSSYLFDTKGFDMEMDQVILDGNRPYLKTGVGPFINISDASSVTVNQGVEVRNTAFSAGGTVFLLGSSSTPTTLTINGGWYHDLTGFAGLFVNGSGLALSNYVPGRCVINDCLVENNSGTYGTIYAYRFVDIVLNGGTFRNNTMKNGWGTLAAITGDARCTFTIGTPAEGLPQSLGGDILLLNTKSSSDGVSITKDCAVTLSAPLQVNLNISGSMMVWGITLVEGADGYLLTQADADHILPTTGDAVALNPRSNTIEIAKTR